MKIQKYETSYWPALPHWLPRSPMVYAPLCDQRKGTFLFCLLSLLLVYCVSVWRDSFPFLLPLFKTEEMLFSVSHAASYVKKDKLFKVLEKPSKNHPRCEKLVIKAWWPKHVVQRKGNESLTHWLEIFCDFSTKSLGKMDVEESQSFSNSFEKLWEDSNEQNVLQYMLGK